MNSTIYVMTESPTTQAGVTQARQRLVHVVDKADLPGFHNVVEVGHAFIVHRDSLELFDKEKHKDLVK